MFVSDVPKLMKEWDLSHNFTLGFNPAKMKVHSNIKVWWRCAKGHEWFGSIDKRMKGQNCPYCSRRRVLKGDNDLLTTHPEVATEWDYETNAPLKPDEVTAISIKRVSWICARCGHRWETRIRDRALKGTGCAKCSVRLMSDKRIQTFVRKNGSLSITNPTLLQEWDYTKNTISPDAITAHSNKKVWWKCEKCGYEWQATIANRSIGGGCPCCSHKRLVIGKNDLATTHPQLAEEWHPTKNGSLTPRDVVSGQSRKVWWLCPRGHSYMATLNHRTSKNGTCCPVCNSGRQTSFREQAFYYYLHQV